MDKARNHLTSVPSAIAALVVFCVAAGTLMASGSIPARALCSCKALADCNGARACGVGGSCSCCRLDGGMWMCKCCDTSFDCLNPPSGWRCSDVLAGS